MHTLTFTKPSTKAPIKVGVPSSKSISNRALIIRSLSGVHYEINNLSLARDTRILQKLLKSDKEVYEAQDAGTVMRFLTAYLAFTTKGTRILSGTERAHDRPIDILVTVLRDLGAQIEYLEKDGFPPLKISVSDLNKLSEIEIAGNVSSQFISALMMIAPLLEGGLTIRLIPPVISEPYIVLTLDMLYYHDIEAAYVNDLIRINQGSYSPKEYTVEADWSSAVFLYSLCLSSGLDIFIKDLKLDSLQADAEIQFIMHDLGVTSDQKKDGVFIQSSGNYPECILWDCTDCPDLVPALCYSLAAKGIAAKLRGTSHLKYKESDRALAIKNELEKTGCSVKLEDNQITLTGRVNVDHVQLNTYRDHRMAMSSAILSTVIESIEIQDPEVVDKSYPTFWNEVNKVGIELKK